MLSATQWVVAIIFAILAGFGLGAIGDITDMPIWLAAVICFLIAILYVEAR